MCPWKYIDVIKHILSLQCLLPFLEICRNLFFYSMNKAIHFYYHFFLVFNIYIVVFSWRLRQGPWHYATPICICLSNNYNSLENILQCCCKSLQISRDNCIIHSSFTNSTIEEEEEFQLMSVVLPTMILSVLYILHMKLLNIECMKMNKQYTIY